MAGFWELVSKFADESPYMEGRATGNATGLVYEEPSIFRGIWDWLTGSERFADEKKPKTEAELLASGDYIIDTPADRQKRQQYQEYESNSPIRQEMRAINQRTSGAKLEADGTFKGGFNPLMQQAARAAQAELGVSGETSYLDMKGHDDWKKYDECMLKHARALEVAHNMKQEFQNSRAQCEQVSPEMASADVRLGSVTGNFKPPAQAAQRRA